MNIYDFFGYFIMFLMYSIVGWCIEVMLTLINEKKFVDRGFLLGPYCPIYGYGMLLIVFLLKDYTDNVLVLFILSMVICLLLEYMVSYFMELLFKARWWDYSSKKYNINGRICLDNLVLFGVLGLLIFYVANPFFSSLIDRFNDTVLIVVSIVLFVLFVIDSIISLKVISGFKNVAKSIHKDSTDEITSKVRELLLEKNWLYKRLIKAFDFKASERLLKELHKKAKETIEKGVEATQKTIQAGASVAHKTIKTGVEVTQKTIKETKKIVKEKVSDFNDKKRN